MSEKLLPPNCLDCILAKPASNFVGFIPTCIKDPSHPKHAFILKGYIPESFPKPTPRTFCDAPRLFVSREVLEIP